MTTDDQLDDLTLQEPSGAPQKPAGAPQEPAAAQEPPTDPQEPTGAPDELDDSTPDPRLTKARREAQNHRERLHTAEADRDNARAAVNRLHRQRAEELGEAWGLRDGADLWRHGTELGDLLDDTGGLDPDLVRDAVQGLGHNARHLLLPDAYLTREQGRTHLGPADRLRWGTEPPPDADDETWDEWRASRVRAGRYRLGTNPGDSAPKPEPTWAGALSVLKRRG